MSRLARLLSRSRPRSDPNCSECTERKLNDCNHEIMPVFSFKGVSCLCKCVDCYDGDSVTLIFDYKGDIVKVKTRLWGINTPEIRTKDDEEKARGFAARDYLKSQIENKIIWAEFLENEKFGRALVKLYLVRGGKLINDDLVEKGHAVEYMR